MIHMKKCLKGSVMDRELETLLNEVICAQLAGYSCFFQ